jgi:hypothetical protein
LTFSLRRTFSVIRFGLRHTRGFSRLGEAYRERRDIISRKAAVKQI